MGKCERSLPIAQGNFFTQVSGPFVCKCRGGGYGCEKALYIPLYIGVSVCLGTWERLHISSNDIRVPFIRPEKCKDEQKFLKESMDNQLGVEDTVFSPGMNLPVIA